MIDELNALDEIASGGGSMFGFDLLGGSPKPPSKKKKEEVVLTQTT